MDNFSEPTDPNNELERELRGLQASAPDQRLRERIDLERELSGMAPLAPSELNRERILLACGLSQGVGETSPQPVTQNSRRLPLVWIAAAAALLFGIWLALATLQQPGQTAKDPKPEPIPAPKPESAPAPVLIADAVEKENAPFALPALYTPISASRTYVSSKAIGVERVDGKPVQVYQVNLRDRLEYEHKGRRVVVERPVQQTVRNEIAFY